MREKLLSLFVVLFCAFCITTLPGCSQTHKNEIQSPLSSDDCYRMDYVAVISEFENAGFSNIQTTILDDLVTGWITKDGSVESISIGNSSDFKKGTWFPKETIVNITYHTFPKKEPESTEPTSLPTQESSFLAQEHVNIFSTLTDEQFCTLTDAVAKSFYSFALSESEYQSLVADEEVMNCLTQIYNYAYKNYFELDPEYRSAFSHRQEVVSTLPSYDILKERFSLEHYLDSKSGEWVYSINSFTINPNDVVMYDGVIYIDAEGYLDKGVAIYWEEDGSMVKVGEIVDIAYDKEIDGTVYGYAINVEYYDDPYSSGWTDGGTLLTMNKQYTGKPIYYIAALDPNRVIAKESIDYNNSVNWKSLTQENLKPGIDVYIGITDTKSYIFTVVDVDPINDKITVRYPSGSVEAKSYSAMLELGFLYIK